MPSDLVAFYSNDPAQYAANTDREKMPQAFHEVRDTFLAYVDDHASGREILDAGCGPGHDMDYFVDAGYDAIGIDITPEMIAYAEEHNRGTYDVMRVDDLSFNDGTFDGVWCNATIFHLPPDAMRDGVDELYRVLKNEGVMHISYKLGDGTVQQEKNGETVDQFRVSHDTAQEMLDAAGFTMLDAQRNPVTEDRVFGNYFCQK